MGATRLFLAACCGLIANAAAAEQESTTTATGNLAFTQQCHMVMKTFGDVKVHYGEAAPAAAGNKAVIIAEKKDAWKFMARAIGLTQADGSLEFAGDVFHSALAGVVIAVEGLTLPEVVAHKEKFPNLYQMFTQDQAVPTLAIRNCDTSVTGELVAPVIQLLREQSPNSLVVAAGGTHAKRGESAAQTEEFFDSISNVLGRQSTSVRVHRVKCTGLKCKSKFVSNFGAPQTNSVAERSELLTVMFNGVDTLILDTELSLASNVAEDIVARHESLLSDGQQDLIIIRLRTTNQPVESVQILDSMLPMLMDAIANVAPFKRAVAQVVLVPEPAEFNHQLPLERRDLATETSRKLLVTPPFRGFDYMYISWTVVWLTVLTFIIFVCVPWSEPLDPILRQQLKNESDEKR